MRKLFLILMIAIIAVPALASLPVKIAIDPKAPLKGDALFSGPEITLEKGWSKTGITNGQDLDLGFNDFLDIVLACDKSGSGPVCLRYGTTFRPGLDASREITIPAKILKRDGQKHVYRLSMDLEIPWRGSLTDIALLPTADGKKSGVSIIKVTIGDRPEDVYVVRPEKEYPTTKYELESKHFRFVWNEATAAKGMDEKWAHGCLRNAEECRAFYVNGLKVPEPTKKAPNGARYKTLFTCIHPGFWGGGGTILNIDLSGQTVDPPNWVIPHEFRHVCQDYMKNGDTPNWSDMYESDANYARERWLWYYGPTFDPKGPKNSITHLGLVNYCLPHGRTYYACWPIAVYLDENPDKLPGLGNEFWSRVWREQKQNEYWLDTVARLSDKVSLKEIFGYNARRRSYNFAHKVEKDTCERTEMKVVPDEPGWWQPPAEMAPMQGGFDVIDLIPEGKSRVVTVDFKGLPDKALGFDWRACLAVINDKGGERYTSLWNSGKQSVKLGPDENKVVLTVAATPDKVYPTDFDDIKCPYRTDPSKARLQYFIQVTGAKLVESSPKLEAGFHKHENGGGNVADSASVDPSVYVGPNAVVSGSAKVTGNVRIEDYAVVGDSAEVSDNAIISGHAQVRGKSVVKDNVKVRDYAVIRNVTASDDVRILEHSSARDMTIKDYATLKGRADCWGDKDSTISGDACADGDRCGGQPLTNGFHYGHMPWQGDIWTDKCTAPSRVLAQYNFDTEFESIARDSYGSADGILRGNPKWYAPTSEMSGVMAFDGKSYILLDRFLVDLREFTITAKVRWDGGKANQAIWAFGASPDQCMWLTPDDGNGKMKFTARFSGMEASITAPAAMPKDRWVRVTVTPDGIYLDNNLVAEGKITIRPDQVLPANVNSVAQHVYFGRGIDPTQPFFTGAVDSLAFYSKAFTPDDVKMLGAVDAVQIHPVF